LLPCLTKDPGLIGRSHVDFGCIEPFERCLIGLASNIEHHAQGPRDYGRFWSQVLPTAQVAVGIRVRLYATTRQLRCPSTSTVCVCHSSQLKLHWPPDLASPPLHQRAHHGAHAQNRPCRWAEQGSYSHKEGQEGQAFPQQRSKYAAHPQALQQPRSLVFVQTCAYSNSHSGRGTMARLYMKIAAAETRQANKAHP